MIGSPHLVVAAAALWLAALPAHPQDQPTEREQQLRQLEQLQRMREQMLEQMQQFDERIRQLEKELDAPERLISEAIPAVEKPPESAAAGPTWGTYEPGKGFVLARTEQGEVDFAVYTYVRYLNQRALDDTYTDAFGRTSDLDLRHDIQLQKLTINFKGWFIDPRFRYLFYTWTSNTSQGDPAQVVVAGNLGYQFNDAFHLYGGIGALPSTRSTNYTFPNWLKNDHRTMADEFFRGSYTTGIWASGEVLPKLHYRAMLGNNLSQLGVNAAQLDDELNTVSAALWWMPTTGEFGPGQGLGDYEFHDQLATLVGVHFTRSREDAQAQPGTEGFENTQIRLSDGTLIFSDDPFLTGAQVRKATYQMMAANAGLKYRGWHLEAEYYYRWVDDFSTTGPIPVDELNDHGFQIQGSTMLVPKWWQAYLGYSQISGEYGDPYDFSVGVNWFPFGRNEVRFNVQGLYLDDSPVGYSSVPFTVGANGWVFSSDLIVAF